MCLFENIRNPSVVCTKKTQKINYIFWYTPNHWNPLKHRSLWGLEENVVHGGLFYLTLTFVGCFWYKLGSTSNFTQSKSGILITGRYDQFKRRSPLAQYMWFRLFLLPSSGLFPSSNISAVKRIDSLKKWWVLKKISLTKMRYMGSFFFSSSLLASFLFPFCSFFLIAS